MTEIGRAIAEDARELRRGVLVTYLGYALKLGMPALIALATRAYGVERWGLFVSAQAVMLVAARVCLVGLDKGLLWAIPARATEDELRGVRPALMIVTLNGGLITLALWAGPSLLGLLDSAEASALRIVALGTVPFVVSELLIHATMGKRRMELQVVVREIMNPVVQVGAALVLFALGWDRGGLAWSFVISQLVGLVVAWFGFRRLFRDISWPTCEGLTIPKSLLRYAAPLCLADTANSLLLRLDMLVLTALSDPVAVGVWGVIGQFANALRQIRRAYDPMVTAITARIAVQPDVRRLTEAFSYAAQMVSLTQLPAFAFLFACADVLLPLYGPGFERGIHALIVLAGFFLISGGTGLAGLVVSGYGRSGLTLVNVLLNLILQFAMLLWFVPPYGLVGAAIAIGAALCAVNGVQVVQMRIITGSFHVAPRTRFSLAVLAGSGATMAASWFAARVLELPPWSTRAALLLGFAAAYTGMCILGLRRGILRAPDAASPSLPDEPAAAA